MRTGWNASPGSLLPLVDCVGVEISNLTLDGNGSAIIYGAETSETKGIQFEADGLHVRRGKQVSITNVAIVNCGRDGIYYWGTGERPPTGTLDPKFDSAVFENCSCVGNNRQGMSLVGGRWLTFVNCEFSQTGQGVYSSPPASGVDIEANEGYWISNLLVTNCYFVNNFGPALQTGNGLCNNIIVLGGEFWQGFLPVAGKTKGSNDAFFFGADINKADLPSATNTFMYSELIKFDGTRFHAALGSAGPRTRFESCWFDDAVHPVYGRSGQNRSSGGVIYQISNGKGYFRTVGSA